MKVVTWVVALALLLLSERAQAYPLPQNFCYSGCTPEQQELWARFSASDAFHAIRKPTMYSGPCYHLTRMYNGSDAHFAGVLIDVDAKGAPTFSGIFSFFAPNRYSTWSLAEARTKLKRAHPMELGASEAFIDTNPGGETMMYYWLRDEEQTGSLLMIATWGIHHQLFCELTPNEGEGYE